jgi:DNA polymerase III subunit epsilon
MVIGLFKKRKPNVKGGSIRGKGGERIPLRDIPYVILDTELTGLDRKRDSIVSVGALKMLGGRIEVGRTFYQLVNPRSEMKPETVVIHGITPSEVSEKPVIDKVLSTLLDFCGMDVLVGHYLSIDLHFINREMKRVLGGTLENPAIDTLTLVDWLRWNTPNHGEDVFKPESYQLYEIAKSLGVPVQGAHNALRDAFMTAQVFQRLLPRLERCGVDTLGELLRVGSPSRKLHQQGMVI